jgi:hypothetical protein
MENSRDMHIMEKHLHSATQSHLGDLVFSTEFVPAWLYLSTLPGDYPCKVSRQDMERYSPMGFAKQRGKP